MTKFFSDFSAAVYFFMMLRKVDCRGVGLPNKMTAGLRAVGMMLEAREHSMKMLGIIREGEAAVERAEEEHATRH